MPYPKSYLPRGFGRSYVDYRPIRGLISRELHERVGQRILEVNGLAMPGPPRLDDGGLLEPTPTALAVRLGRPLTTAEHAWLGQEILRRYGLVMPLPPRLPLPGSEDPLAILAEGLDDDEEDAEGETLMPVTRRYFGD
ncbi:hypothetical protein [Methyloparacoccus murrellii]